MGLRPQGDKKTPSAQQLLSMEAVPSPFVIPRACDFFDLLVFFAADQMFLNPLRKGVILRACNFFDLFVFSA